MATKFLDCPQRRGLAEYLVSAILGACLSGAILAALCSCGSTTREKAVATTLAGVDAARDGFVAFDHQFQQTIVRHAKGLDDGQDALRAYRERRDQVMIAFSIAYSAVAAAAVDASPDSMVSAALALKELRDAIQALRTGEGR